jgi:hypothetical protein
LLLLLLKDGGAPGYDAEPDDEAEWLMTSLTASFSGPDDIFGRDKALLQCFHLNVLDICHISYEI